METEPTKSQKSGRSFLLLLVVTLVLVLIVLFVAYLDRDPAAAELDPLEMIRQEFVYTDDSRIGVEVGGNTYCAEVARSFQKRAWGVSVYEPGEFTGDDAMLFLFLEDPVVETFWMKDVKFDIDIVWIDGSEVVDINRHVPHPAGSVDDADLPRYTPSQPINIVIETPTGGSDGIEVGDAVTYTESCLEAQS